MTTLQRKSPKLTPNYSRDDVRDAINALEDRPRIPEGTPASSSADGYEGAIKVDDNYIYVYTRAGQWKRAALSTF